MTLSGGFSLTPPPPPAAPSSINYLLVGGGGGGGAGNDWLSPGGGGGGGQVLNANLSGLSQGTTITVTVGAGGTNGLADGTTGTAGANSSIATSGTISALPGQYGINFPANNDINPWGGTSGSVNQGGTGDVNNAAGSSGGGNATVGYNWNAASPNGAGGGWGTLVSAFDMYGTDVNNISTFTLSGVVITGAAGQFSCIYSSSVLSVGMAVTISGTYGGTGTITGYTDPTTYYIITTNGSTTFTLSATLGGSAITTTAGTPTGLTYTIASTSTKGYFGGGGGGGMWWAYGYLGLGGRGGGARGGDGSGVRAIGVVITGTDGQFSCTSLTPPSSQGIVLSVGTAVTISGTYGGTGTITGYTNPTTYYIIATNGSTTFTLSATLGGSAITTTAGTPTGLTWRIQTPTPTYLGLSGFPNTGGGGGAGGAGLNGRKLASPGGTGGSGVVIIRYADAYAAASATTGSPTVTTSNGYRYYAYTSSGSLTI